MIEKAVASRLSAYSGLTALVPSARITPQPLPQASTVPAVTYARVSTTRQSAMGSDTGDATARVQIDCWADTLLSALNVSEQVRAALQRWNGSAGGVTVTASFLANQITMYEDETLKHRVMQDYMMWFRE